MQRMLLIISLPVITAYVALCVLMFLTQRRLIYHPADTKRLTS